ncbi:MAG: multidrug ABC transporter substrate-binding protein [Bdellovibrio sp.]|nr:MAG: multidrug ABC transporter substrate-binding protein [Bdellovibrio sp.]
MKVKFNRFERMAGLFVLGAIGSFGFAIAGMAIKQGWFDSKTAYQTIFESADGIHVGSAVHISGLPAGEVQEVDLTDDNRILVKFYVFSRFENKIREDSSVQLLRPFVIGERIMEVTVGSSSLPQLKAGAKMSSVESMDLLTLMSGRKLGVYMGSLSEAAGNLRALAEAFLNKDRTESLVRLFDRLTPLISNLNTMSIEVIKLSKQATRDEHFGVVFGELATTTKELNEVLPMLKIKAPQMAADTEKLITNLAILTEQFKLLTPAFTEIAPELPKASRRALEALDESVVLLKAMQKSFFLRSSAQEVREEEKKRTPASIEPAKGSTNSNP